METGPVLSNRVAGGTIRATILLGVAVAAWAAMAAGVLAVLLVDGVGASLITQIDRLGITLPVLGPLSGAFLVSRMSDKLAMLCFAIVPVLLLEVALLDPRDHSLGRICRDRSTSSLTDLAIYILNLVGLWRLFSVVATLGLVSVVGVLAAAIVGTMTHLDLRLHTGSLLVDSLLAFLLFSFCDYWNHRLQHHNPLWPLHRIHHGASEMTVLTLWRAHPAIAAVEPLIKLWPLALFDIPAGTVAVVGMATVAYEHLIHSNLRWNWGWFGRWILIPPTGHRLHHHIDLACQHKNFGIPVIWDRMFGTWDGGPPPGEQLGIADIPYNTGRPVQELFRDLVDFLTELWRFARRVVSR
jgi:sterol desaturase/sphingolipid hydroxylase (fatty acid hydroxylase superfamily)